LAGMRERIREQGGTFEVQSDETGTTVSVTIPIAAEIASNPLAAAASAD
jgi:signal transduction histidine kinase